MFLVNDGSAAATVSVRFFRSDPVTHATQPWTLALVGNQATENIVIQPGTTYILETAASDAANTVSGWAEVVASSAIGGFAVFHQLIGASQQEAAVPLNRTGAQRLLLPYDNQGGFTTSVAVVNLSTTGEAPVTIKFRNSDGTERTEQLGRIPPRGHWAFNLIAQFGFLTNSRGVAEFSSPGGELSMLGLRFNSSNAFTSFRASPPSP
jgi:hypothetical protein